MPPQRTLKPQRTDIDRAQTIHDLKQEFDLPKEAEEALLRQLKESEVGANIERFLRGFGFESLFELLFAELPWLKLIHRLGQSQMPEYSKRNYQVPDFTILYEASSPPCRPLLVEVKSVKGTRKTAELMSKQVEIAEKYASNLGVPLVYAVHWEGFNSWTVNPSDQFDAKGSKLVLSLGDAHQGDLSCVLGDLTYIVPPFQRVLVCDKSVTDPALPTHETAGTVVSDSISFDGKEFHEIEGIESCALDSLMQMKVAKKTRNGAQTTIEEYTDSFYMPKLSHWTLATLSHFGGEVKAELIRFVMTRICDLMKRTGCHFSHMVPSKASDKTRYIYREAFAGTDLWRNYVKHHGA